MKEWWALSMTLATERLCGDQILPLALFNKLSTLLREGLFAFPVNLGAVSFTDFSKKKKDIRGDFSSSVGCEIIP
jgi:hypothetical protein